MWLQELFVRDFRNIERVELRLSPSWNVFFGRNAQGKTNVLEAVYFLSTLRSFRTKNIEDIPRCGVDSFLLRSVVRTPAAPCQVKALYEGGRKKAFINDEPVSSAEKLIGLCPLVLATHANIDLCGETPARIRRFLDAQLSQSLPEYLQTIMKYEKVLRFRNALLRSGKGASGSAEMRTWTHQLVVLGAQIFEWRQKAVTRLNIFGRLSLKKISDGREEMEIRYATQAEGGSLSEIQAAYARHLETSSLKERERGFTLVGPHRDSLVFLLGGKPAAKFASQGQRKSLGLALKLAEAENIRSFSRQEPAIVLDEVLSELDEERRRQFALLIGEKKQVFCATADRALLEEIKGYGAGTGLFHMSAGKAKRA